MTTTTRTRSIGIPIERKDGAWKVQGLADYTADRLPERATYGGFATSPVANGRITSLNIGDAERAPGVVAVLTFQNVPKLASLATLTPAPAAQALLPMQGDRVRYEGEPIALVIADTLERALYAASLVSARIEPFPHRVAIGDALDEGAILAGGYDEPDTCTGDPEAGLHQADVRVEARYTTSYRHHVAMEPSATVAEWDGERLTVWDSTQHVWADRAALATAFGIQPTAVRVISNYVGGGFGGKGLCWPHQFLTALAARVVGRPVKVVLTRANAFTAHGYQSESVQDVAVGARRDGTLTAIVHHVTYANPLEETFWEYFAAGTRSLYACPAIATTHRAVKVALQLPTAMRAPNEAVGNVALESTLDELAERLAIDPLELRLRNYAEREPTSGRPFSSKKLREAYLLGAERFGWAARDPRPRGIREGDDLVGYGMATALMKTYRYPSHAVVAVRADGSVIVRSGAQEIGNGIRTVIPQIAADVLGVDIDRVTMELGDTMLPEAGPTYGSSSTIGVGSAVADAAMKLLARLRELGGSDAEGYAAAAARAGGEISTEGSFVPGADEYAMFAFGAVFVEVRVDASLGIVHVRRCVGAYSAGRIVNPRTAASQITGGMIWGIGQALLERSETDSRLGRFLSKNLAGYLIPANADVPKLEAYFVEEYDPHASAIGVRGIGEVGATGVGAAIANAVYHATGVRVRDLPITPERLLSSLS